MSDTTHYELLGVDADAPKDDIRAAYQGKLADVRQARTKEEGTRRPSDDAIRAARDEEARLRAAWQVLSDPVQRDRYDTKIGVNGTGDTDVVDEDHDEDDDPGDELKPRDRTPLRPDPGAQSIVTADGLELPTTGRRATAAVIDLITMIAIYIVITNLVLVAGVKSGIPAVISGSLTAEFVIVVYLIIPTLRRGQTIGKRYTHSMVVDRATGNLPSLSQVIRRYALPAVALLALPVLGTIGALIAMFYALSFLMQREQVSLADRWANTVVVIARYRPAPAGG